MAKLIPLQDNVIVEPLKEDSMTASGIVIPDTVSKEKPMRGTVLSVGPGKMDAQGKIVPVGVSEGDIVLFTKYAPTEIKIEGKELYVLGADSILAIQK